MPKNIEDIIVPERKRSIRDIPIPENRRKNDKYAVPVSLGEYHSPITLRDNPDISQEGRKSSTWRGRKSTWVAAGGALLVLVFAILSVFNGATLAYLPKSATLSFDNEVYTAQKTGNEGLLFSVVKLSEDKGLEVSASEEEEVRRKASGVIIVYNNASTEAQRLIENTRFETPSGLVYRISDAIVIPGRKTVGGKTQPGALEVTVYADEVGEKYNIGLTDFTVPGLAGTARFSTIYARSKTEMTGGFVGREKVVNSQDRARVKAELETTLRNELLSEIKARVPEDFILFPSLSFITFEDLPQTDSLSKGKVTVNVRGRLDGVMFKKSDLSTRLALNKITLAPGEAIDTSTFDSLNFSFISISREDLFSSDKISFSVTGQTTAIWRTDEVALRTDLIGKHKRDLPSILNNYPTIISATATIRPFWKNSFSDNSARISIEKLPVK